MIFPAMPSYAFANILNNNGKPVAAYVRMRVYKYGRVRSEAYQLVQNLPYVTPFRRACIKLSVGKSPGAALTEAIVGIWVHDALT